MSHYALKINFLFILQSCHLLGVNVTVAAHSGAMSTLSFIGPLQQQSHRTTYGTRVGLDLRSHPPIWVQNANSFLPWRGAPTEGQLQSCRPPEAPSCSHLRQFPYLGRRAVPRRTPHRGPHTAPPSPGRGGIVFFLQHADLLKMGAATGHAVRQSGSRSSSEGRYRVFLRINCKTEPNK